jgi:quinol monooxygenase YgiN
MAIERRAFIAGTVAVAAAAAGSAQAAGGQMFGLIGQMRAQPGKRDELIGVLLAGVGAMPGCLSYVVAKDAKDGDAIWITEVWESAEAHMASLRLPAVAGAIAKGRPLIAGFGEHFETAPVAGVGLKA